MGENCYEKGCYFNEKPFTYRASSGCLIITIKNLQNFYIFAGAGMKSFTFLLLLLGMWGKKMGFLPGMLLDGNVVVNIFPLSFPEAVVNVQPVQESEFLGSGIYFNR